MITNQRKRVEERVIEHDGRERFIETIKSPIVDSQGGVIGTAGIARDITERKRAELALRRNEERFRSIAESITDVIYRLNPDGSVIYASPSVQSVLGFTVEETVGKNFTQFIHPDDMEIAGDAYRQLLEGKKIRNLYLRVLKKAGGAIHAEVNVIPLAHDGTVFEIQGVISDITERKRAEQVLRGSEERLRQVVRVSQIGIFDHDHITDTIYWSPQQRATYGFSPDETVTLPAFLACVHSEDRQRIAAALRRAQDPAGDGSFDAQHRIIRRDGAIRWLDTRSQTLFLGEGGASHPVRTIGAVRDITESKRSEEEREKLQAQFIQAQKMESVGRLAGGVAHDFNNMLNVILGYAEIALKQLGQDSLLRDSLQNIQKAAKRSADLTRQLLAFARKQTIAPRLLDLNETAEGILKLLLRLIGENITVSWVPGRGLWTIKIDPAQVDQILANLLVNARDAIADKGKITIETDNVVLDEAYCAGHRGFVPGKFAMLAVSDDGCGMDQDHLAHIFEPFFTTKGVGRGTGLGLATVYGIVKQNDGFINVYSEPGKGTTIKIYLPSYEARTVPVTVESPAPAAKGGTETILLVEDEPMVLNLCKTLLEDMGFTVLTAGAPGDAMRLAEEHAGQIHLLITDVVMPEMNGWDLAKRLLSLYPDLKSLFMSGYTSNVIAQRFVLEDGVHFMQKPFTENELTAKVREALEKNQAFGEAGS
jgi:PAS domain S-box-containing protein